MALHFFNQSEAKINWVKVYLECVENFLVDNWKSTDKDFGWFALLFIWTYNRRLVANFDQKMTIFAKNNH